MLGEMLFSRQHCICTLAKLAEAKKIRPDGPDKVKKWEEEWDDAIEKIRQGRYEGVQTLIRIVKEVIEFTESHGSIECPNCGHLNPRSANICQNCGLPIYIPDPGIFSALSTGGHRE